MSVTLLSVLAASGSGCGTTSSSARSTSPASASSEGEAPLEAMDLVLQPQGRPSPNYGGPVPPPTGATPLAGLFSDALDQLSERTSNHRPQPDGRLFATAADLARIVPREASLPYAAVAFTLHYYGIVEPTPSMVVVWSTGTPESEASYRSVLEHLVERSHAIMSDSDQHRYGLASQQRDGGEQATVLLLQRSYLDVSPLPRSLEKRAKLRGSVDPGFDQVELVITRSTEAIERKPLALDRKRRFSAQVACGDLVGPQQVELLGSSERGPTVLANFPVWCGEKPPDSYALRVAANTPQNAEDAEKALLQLANRERSKRGLYPLQAHKDVAEVARTHSEEMHDTGVVAHTSPTSGTAADRLRAAGVRTPLVLENLARANTVQEAHDGLMASPSHRANILSSEATHLGSGVVMGRDERGKGDLYVTQVFIRVPPKIDADDAMTLLLQRIRSLGLKSDDVLNGAAQAQADELADGSSGQVAAGKAQSELARKNTRFRKVRTIVTALADVESFQPDKSISRGGMSHFGVGIAQGHHPRFGDNTIYVVILSAKAARRS